MNNQEQRPVYDFEKGNTRSQIIRAGLLSIANGISVALTMGLMQTESEYKFLALGITGGLHLAQVLNAGLQFRRDITSPDIQFPDGGVMRPGWRGRLAIKNLIPNMVPFIFSGLAYAGISTGDSIPTPPLPTPGAEIQV